jgi:hypothetical protein
MDLKARLLAPGPRETKDTSDTEDTSLGQKILQGMGLSGRGYERERETAEGGKRCSLRPGAPGGAGGRALRYRARTGSENPHLDSW